MTGRRGGPNDGNEWRKYRVGPRAHPLRPLAYACSNRSGNKGVFRLPGVTRDRFRCTVASSPGHVWCRNQGMIAGQLTSFRDPGHRKYGK